MADFFKFEADFVDSLRCIPMQVRLKLDTCGVKLKLHHWHQFNQLEKEKLVQQPCSNFQEVINYKRDLQDLILSKTGEYAKELEISLNPAWQNLAEIPEQVSNKAQEFNLNLTVEQWQKLTDLQRFALIKLSQSGHENNNFLPALKEFKLL